MNQASCHSTRRSTYIRQVKGGVHWKYQWAHSSPSLGGSVSEPKDSCSLGHFFFLWIQCIHNVWRSGGQGWVVLAVEIKHPSRSRTLCELHTFIKQPTWFSVQSGSIIEVTGSFYERAGASVNLFSLLLVAHKYISKSEHPIHWFIYTHLTIMSKPFHY